MDLQWPVDHFENQTLLDYLENHMVHRTVNTIHRALVMMALVVIPTEVFRRKHFRKQGYCENARHNHLSKQLLLRKPVFAFPQSSSVLYPNKTCPQLRSDLGPRTLQQRCDWQDPRYLCSSQLPQRWKNSSAQITQIELHSDENWCDSWHSLHESGGKRVAV